MNEKERKEYNKRYYQNNKEKLLQNHKQWAVQNKDHLGEYNKTYREDNKLEITQYKNNYRATHKEQANQIQKRYYQNNKEKVLENNKKSYQKNKQRYKTSKKEYSKKYNLIHKQEIRKKYRERIQKDISLKLRTNLSRSINYYLKKFLSSKNGNSIVNFLPFTIEELKNHLESLFLHSDNLTPDGQVWMSWNNWGKYRYETWDDNDHSTWVWHIDHIIPQSDLPYTSMEDKNFKKCWALENLRPLRADINLIEGATRIRHGGIK